MKSDTQRATDTRENELKKQAPDFCIQFPLQEVDSSKQTPNSGVRFPFPEIDSSKHPPSSPEINSSPAKPGQVVPLYNVAHSRAGDKGNDLNFSIIPHFPPDIDRLRAVITPKWVKSVVAALLNRSPFQNPDAIRKRDEFVDENVKVDIYEVTGICSLNVVVRNILDGGVNCSRRIDRHGKCISDVILSQLVVLPP